MIRKTTWNTYAIRAYTYDATNDHASAGGVHLMQIKYTRRGWVCRVVQSNGRHKSYTAPEPVDADHGQRMFALACQR